MLKPEQETVGRIVPGLLVYSVKGNVSLFTEKSDDVLRLEKDLEDARIKQRRQQQEFILPVFRSVVKEFFETYNEPVTKCYVNYRDYDLLCDAYNEERIKNVDSEGKFPRDRVSCCDPQIIIDGVIVKKGCDREFGELNIHSFQ